MENTNPSREAQNSELTDERISDIEEARTLARQMINERMKVDSRPEYDGNGETIIDVEYPDREPICQDLVRRTVDSGYYVETETYTVKTGRGTAEERIGIDEDRYIVRVADSELVIPAESSMISIREADAETDMTPPEDQTTLAEPPLYSDSDDSEGGQA